MRSETWSELPFRALRKSCFAKITEGMTQAFLTCNSASHQTHKLLYLVTFSSRVFWIFSSKGTAVMSVMSAVGISISGFIILRSFSCLDKGFQVAFHKTHMKGITKRNFKINQTLLAVKKTVQATRNFVLCLTEGLPHTCVLLG